MKDAPSSAKWRREGAIGGVEMKKVACAILLLLALSSGAVQAQESRAAHLDVSWSAAFWAALGDLVTAIFAPDQEPTSPPDVMSGDCGAAMDPTGGCRR
ncbi:MAG TPA: hypothetical protein VKM72_12835 [Thermoanaerobaculia bacterium]|nr:hypothetical protein [Thermoanaerobaculia bacterium]